MIGMLQIMIYLLGIYLIFKGIEIFQIAWMSPRENKAGGVMLGVVMIILSVLLAFGFAYWGDEQAKSVSDGMKSNPILNR